MNARPIGGRDWLLSRARLRTKRGWATLSIATFLAAITLLLPHADATALMGGLGLM